MTVYNSHRIVVQLLHISWSADKRRRKGGTFSNISQGCSVSYSVGQTVEQFHSNVILLLLRTVKSQAVLVCLSICSDNILLKQSSRMMENLEPFIETLEKTI